MNKEQVITITLYKYLSAIALKKFIENKTIKLSFGYDTNDCFEMLRGDLVPQRNREELEIEFESGTHTGFISLTAVKENPYMWGYYSEKYRGARLKLRFKVIKQDNDKNDTRYLRVDVPPPCQKELAPIKNSHFDGEYIEKCEYEVNRIDKIDTSLQKCTKNIISNKHISWQSEHEYRILYSVNSPDKRSLSSLLTNEGDGLYTTADLNRNIVALELGPFCEIMLSTVKRELFKDETLRGIVVHRCQFASGLYDAKRINEEKWYNNDSDSSLSHEDVKLIQEAEIGPIPECKWSPFMCAARRGELSLLQKLYRNKTCVDMVDLFGHSALSLAVLARSRECVKFLISKAATLNNASQKVKDDALLWAAEANNEDFVAKLIQWEARVGSTDGQGRTALHWAARNGNNQCVEIILDAIISDPKKMLKGELERKDSEGRTPLMLAAWSKSR